MYPVFIVSGMIIPLDLIPAGLREISRVISLRWAAEFLAEAAGGTLSLSSLAALIGLTCAYFTVALTAFRALVHRARREGTMDHA
jgi:ABC-2 type transport system permease protein